MEKPKSCEYYLINLKQFTNWKTNIWSIKNSFQSKKKINLYVFQFSTSEIAKYHVMNSWEKYFPSRHEFFESENQLLKSFALTRVSFDITLPPIIHRILCFLFTLTQEGQLWRVHDQGHMHYEKTITSIISNNSKTRNTFFHTWVAENNRCRFILYNQSSKIIVNRFLFSNFATLKGSTAHLKRKF